MAPRLFAYLLALWALAAVPAFGAESSLMSLSNNPFSRPDIFNAPPPPPPTTDPLGVDGRVELNLTATMVSDTTPMVVVDGELLGIGERIQGLKLISVMEGKAVFSGKGRKFTFEIDKTQPTQRAGAAGF